MYIGYFYSIYPDKSLPYIVRYKQSNGQGNAHLALYLTSTDTPSGYFSYVYYLYNNLNWSTDYIIRRLQNNKHHIYEVLDFVLRHPDGTSITHYLTEVEKFKENNKVIVYRS